MSDPGNDTGADCPDETAKSFDRIAGQAPGGRKLSPAAIALLRIPVGVVVERRKADSPWIDFIWRGVGVLPDEPEMKPWTVLREQDEATLYYAGSATVDLYRSETQLYRDNIASGTPSIWIVLSPSEGSWLYDISAVT